MITIEEYLVKLNSLIADEIFLVIEKSGVYPYSYFARVGEGYYRMGDKDMWEPIYVYTEESFTKYVDELGIFHSGCDIVKVK